jgi:Na+-translocating ferredoxin:NAD+ oxidoreductase subunit C
MLEYTIDRSLSGGISLVAHKLRSTKKAIDRGFLPRQLVVPVHQHFGTPADPLVEVGQRLLKGERIASPGRAPSAAVHAPTSGRVRAIEERLVLGYKGLKSSLCIIIDSDGEDRAVEPSARPEWPAERSRRLERIREGGLAGLGGAVFPTADKLAAGTACQALVINGAECEPYISCDDMLMREAPAEIVAGALLMTDLLEAPVCIIAIEEDKPRAIEAMRRAALESGDERIRLAEVPTVYPAGGERQLIELLLGAEVPSRRYPSDIGYVSQNVGTAYALERLARRGEPLVSRIVTVTGGAVLSPRNVEVPIGTPVGELIEHCGGYSAEVVRLIMGGSMMGHALPGDEIPITKASNCIIAAARGEVRESYAEWACIRCGDCAVACPARLLPQQILRAARNDDFEGLEEYGLADCIECGCCDAVCPSHIPLTEYFRRSKHAVARRERRLAFSAESEQRYLRREDRLKTEKERAEAEREALKNEILSSRDARRRAVQEALERARRGKP